MQQLRPNFFARSDTMFGVCEALGRDFGFNPNWLRVALGLGVIYNLEYAVMAYVGLGVLVALVHFIYPERRAAATNSAADASEETVAANGAARTESAAVETVKEDSEMMAAAA